jgi:hypothetical protein
MKLSVSRAVLAAGVLAASSAAPAPARAEEPKSGYVEKKTSGGQFVGFDDDPLSAVTNDPIGTQLRGVHPPRRFQLMRPRIHFVPELLKTVEAM